MSALETPYTREFWRKDLGQGTLYEEFIVVSRARKDKIQERRTVDGIVVLGGKFRIADRGERPKSLDGEDVLVIQTKAERLNPYVFGQALLSPALIRLGDWRPQTLRSVLLCAADNPELGGPLEEVYTMPWQSSTSMQRAGAIECDELATEIKPRVEVSVRQPHRDYCKRPSGWKGAADSVQRQLGGALMAPAKLPGRCEIDGVLLPSCNNTDNHTLADVAGKEVISIHGYKGIVDMYVSGEVVASKVLLKHLGAASVRSIIACKRGDAAIECALDPFARVEIWTQE